VNRINTVRYMGWDLQLHETINSTHVDVFGRICSFVEWQSTCVAINNLEKVIIDNQTSLSVMGNRNGENGCSTYQTCSVVH
jgi:hypothetical protein